MKKLILTLLMLTVIVVLLGAGGTIAYLTGSDETVNLLAEDTVQIRQIEQEWNADRTALQDFTQLKALHPYVGELGWETDGDYRRLTVENAVDKYVSVENTGTTDVYVRTFIALEMGEYTEEEFDMVGLSVNDAALPNGHWQWTDKFVSQINGKNFCILVAVHDVALAPGQTTIPSLLQVYLDKTATNETVLKLDGNGNGAYDIFVHSQAVQTTGFSSAEQALDEAFYDADPMHPWKDRKDQPPVLENNRAEMESDLTLVDLPLFHETQTKDAYVFDGNGKRASGYFTKGDVDATGTVPMSACVFSSKTTETITVRDVTITGTMQMVTAGHYGSKIKHNTVFENVNIKDIDVIYFSNNPYTMAFTVYGNLHMNNCEVTGTKPAAVGEQGKPVYDMGITNSSTVWLNGGQVGSLMLWEHANLYAENAQIGRIVTKDMGLVLGRIEIGSGSQIGEIVTNAGYLNKYPKAGAITIRSGAEVDVLSLNNVWNNAVLVIEDGATVNTLLIDGVAVDYASWKNS